MTTTKGKCLPPAKAWAEREISDWNTTTFCAYLTDRHAALYGIPYVPGRGGWRVEQALIKRMITEHGAEVVKRFVDDCMREYKPSVAWPGLTFTFAYTYMRDRVLPRLLTEVRRDAQRGRVLVSGPSTEEIAEWL